MLGLMKWVFYRMDKRSHLAHKHNAYKCYRYQNGLSIYHLSSLLNSYYCKTQTTYLEQQISLSPPDDDSLTVSS